MRAHVRAVLSAAVVFCAVGMWGQATPATKPAETAPAKSFIEGRVLNAATEEPVRKVTVTLVAAGASSASGIITAETDDTGHFIFQNLQPARYQMYAERTGFARQFYGSRSNAMRGTSLVIATAGQEIKGLVFKLAPTAVIAGRVLDDEGEPMNNAIVMALSPGYTRGKRDLLPLATAQTNDMGEYRLSGLKAGRYVVGAVYRNITAMISASGSQPPGDKPEMAFTTTYFPNMTDAAQATFVEVEMGAEVRGTDIQMVKVPTFRVKGNANELQAGKTVLVTLTPRGAGIAAMVTRNMSMVQPDGSFEFKGVPPGSYWLSAMGTDMTTASVIQPIDVGEQHIQGVALQFVTGGDLPVSVSVEGKTTVDLKTLRLVLNQTDFAAMPKTASFEDGKLTVKSVVPARYEVRVSGAPENVYVKSVRLGTADADEALDLTAGVRGTLQVVLADASAQVDGSVRGGDGNALPGATVALIPASGQTSLFKEITTDQQGGFSFKGVRPGDYRVIAWEDVQTGAPQDPEFVKQFSADTQTLTLKESERRTLALKAVAADKSAAK